MVVCLERGVDCLHMVQLMHWHSKTPSSLASFKSKLVLPFWYRLTGMFFVVVIVVVVVSFSVRARNLQFSVICSWTDFYVRKSYTRITAEGLSVSAPTVRCICDSAFTRRRCAKDLLCRRTTIATSTRESVSGSATVARASNRRATALPI